MQTKHAAPRRLGRPDAQGSEALDRHILATATRLFIEQGYAATSMEQIAVMAGAGKKSIYRRYASKEDLFVAVIGEMSGVLDEAAQAVEKDMPDPLAVLRKTCQALLDLLSRPEVIALYRILIAEALRFPELANRIMRERAEPHYASLRRLIDAARQAGQIRRDCDVEETFRMVSGLFTGWAINQSLLGQKSLNDDRERQAFFEAAWKAFLDGVATS